MTGVLITDAFFRAAVATPDKLALVCGHDAVSYADLAGRVRRMSVARPRVEVLADNGIESIVQILATAAAGSEAVILDPSWPAATRVAAIESLAPSPSPGCFLIVFTSGTTGVPKAIVRTHASWIASFAASAKELGTSSATSVLAPGPLAHGLTLYAAVETLAAGGTVRLLPRFDVDACLAALPSVDTLVAVPTICDLIAAAAVGPMAHLARVVTAGAKLSPALRARLATTFPAAEIIEYYGASELSFVTVAKGDAPPDSVGRAFAGVELAVRDDVVWVKSEMLSLGYLNAPDAAGFRRDGAWATVGDRGVIDQHGYLRLLGREGDMIVTSGLNVYPTEVEALIERHPSVLAAAVFGIDDSRWGQIVAAAVVLQPGAPFDRDALISHCRAHLPSAKTPRRWFCVPALPMTASGKVARAQLPALAR